MLPILRFLTLATLSLLWGAAAQAAPVDTEPLFNWLEDRFPSFLSPRRPATQTLGPYTLRHYPETQSYLGVSGTDNHLYYLSDATGLLDLGDASAIPLPLITLSLCNDVSQTEHQGPISCIGPALSFSSAGTETRNNVYMIMKYPVGNSMGMRVVITKDSPDGRMEQDRVKNATSTEFNSAVSFAMAFPGHYCVRVIDQYDDSIVYSATTCFDVQ